MMYDGDDGDDSWLEIATPVITNPSTGSTGIAIVTALTITVSPVVFQLPGLSLTSTDLEIRTGANGTGTLVYSSSSTLVVPALTLALGTTYYIRVRFNSGIYSSMWSYDTVITTTLV